MRMESLMGGAVASGAGATLRMRRPGFNDGAGFLDGHVAIGGGDDGIGRLFAEGGGHEGGGEAVDIDHGADAEEGAGFIDGVVAAGADHDAQLRVGGERSHSHRDVVAFLAAGRDEGDGPLDPGGMDRGFGRAVSDEDRNAATARDLQCAGIRVLLDADTAMPSCLSSWAKRKPTCPMPTTIT